MGEYIDFKHVKEQASFEPVLAHYDIELVGSGEERRALCPFHDDTEPSLSINVERKMFHCFGCEAKGNILEFVSDMEDCDLREAARVLAKCCGCGLSERSAERTRSEKPQKQPKGRKRRNRPARSQEAPRRAPEQDDEANKPLTFTLPLDPDHPFLEERGLSLEVVEEFGLGFYEGRGKMDGRICIPIHNAEGELVAYCGRWPSNAVPKGEKKYLLPEKFHKQLVLFNLNRLNGSNHVTIVESYFSVFRLHALGVPVVSPMGTSIGEAQVRLLARAGISHVSMLLDGDEAGRKAEERMLPVLARSFFVHAEELPEGAKPHSLDEAELAQFVDLAA